MSRTNAQVRMMLLVSAAVEDRASALRALLGPAGQLPSPLAAGVAALAPQLEFQSLISEKVKAPSACICC